jgi:protein-disulfide isomerase
MASNTTSSNAPRGFPWRARAPFEVAKTRRLRQTQMRRQENALLTILLVALVISAVFMIANWRNGGGTKTVDCAAFPEYCVPLAGGSETFPSLEAPSSRTLDVASEAAPGVVRYVDQNNIPTLGDPAAPVHFVMVSDFACSHCQDYHRTDVPGAISELVLKGKATFGLVMVTGTGRQYSELASQAALCAGEQGAFWEMSEEFFRLAASQSVTQAFSLSQIRDSAKSMGLNSQSLVECVSSNRYSEFLRDYQVFASDYGVTGTPTILASFGDTGEWRVVPRDFGSLQSLADSASAAQ